MREWIGQVMTAAVLSALGELLAPEGRMRRYVAFGIACILLLVLLSPLGEGEALSDWLGELPIGESVGTGAESAAEDAVLGVAETALAVHLAERFGLATGELTLSVSADGALTLSLPRGAPADAIRRYLTENTTLRCEVTVREE